MHFNARALSESPPPKTLPPFEEQGIIRPAGSRAPIGFGRTANEMFGDGEKGSTVHPASRCKCLANRNDERYRDETSQPTTPPSCDLLGHLQDLSLGDGQEARSGDHRRRRGRTRGLHP